MPRIPRGLAEGLVNHVFPYGTPIWQMNVGKELGLESTLRPRGRPRKKVEKA